MKLLNITVVTIGLPIQIASNDATHYKMSAILVGSDIYDSNFFRSDSLLKTLENIKI